MTVSAPLLVSDLGLTGRDSDESVVRRFGGNPLFNGRPVRHIRKDEVQVVGKTAFNGRAIEIAKIVVGIIALAGFAVFMIHFPALLTQYPLITAGSIGGFIALTALAAHVRNRLLQIRLEQTFIASQKTEDEESASEEEEVVPKIAPQESDADELANEQKPLILAAVIAPPESAMKKELKAGVERVFVD